jgi:integral membrane protein
MVGHNGAVTTLLDVRTPATRFRLVAVAEAISWAGLLTGMFFKYVVVHNEIGVQIFGPIHGGVFIAYVAIALWVSRPLGWSKGTTLIGLAASIPPFASVWFERWAARRGDMAELSDAQRELKN